MMTRPQVVLPIQWMAFPNDPSLGHQSNGWLSPMTRPQAIIPVQWTAFPDDPSTSRACCLEDGFHRRPIQWTGKTSKVGGAETTHLRAFLPFSLNTLVVSFLSEFSQ